MIKDEVVAWDNPATVGYQKRRRRVTALQAVACVAVIFFAVQLSRIVNNLSPVLLYLNTACFVAMIGFLLAYSRLSLRERTLRLSEWRPVEVQGRPFSLFGVPLGTVLRTTDQGREVTRIAVCRMGAELLGATSDLQSLVMAGDSSKAFLLARPVGAPVVLARRIGPTGLQNLVWNASKPEQKETL